MLEELKILESIIGDLSGVGLNIVFSWCWVALSVLILFLTSFALSRILSSLSLPNWRDVNEWLKDWDK